MQYSIAVRNARLDSIESTIGASAILKIFDGTMPANCAAADVGTVLATVNLPSNWMEDADAGSKEKSGTWEDLSADNTGTGQYFRVYDNSETECHIQGTVGTVGTDMIVDNTSFVAGQTFVVTTFTITTGNA